MEEDIKRVLLQIRENNGHLEYATESLTKLELLGLIKYLEVIKENMLEEIKNFEDLEND